MISTYDYIAFAASASCVYNDYASEQSGLSPAALKLFDLLRDWRFLKEEEFRTVYHNVSALPSVQSNLLWERLRARLSPEDYMKLHATYLAGTVKYVIFEDDPTVVNDDE